ncbi:MAG: fatty acid--CoA ligase [Rhodospirillales bacterium]
MPQIDPGTLLDSLNATTARVPHKPAFTFEGRSTDFATFARHADRVAAALTAAGIAPGERIAYIGKNSDVYFEALYGAMKAGVVMVPVNWRLAGPEIAVIVEDSQARLILVGPEFADLVASELPNMPRVQTVLASEGGHPVWPDFAAWRDAARDGPPVREASPDDVAVQLYTSGTTGRPKGVMLAHRNFTHGVSANQMSDLPWARWEDGDAAVQAMPVSHISGTGWGIISVHYGATCHIQRQFDLDQTFDMIQQHPISKIFLVPAALQFLVRHPRAKQTDFSRIREMGYGASPIPLALLRESMEMLGCGFVQFYGMTETTGTIVALPPEDHTPDGSPRMRGAGKPLPWVEIRVVDAEGRDVPTGQVGEIVTRSGANMVGYWNRPEETAKTIRDGWLHTGDAGFVDADGYVYIHDRVKDMIISGGENVYPAEVESALSEHPAIAEAAVIGVPDEKWGEAVKAVVVLRPGAALTQQQLIDWSRDRIAAFKAPKSVDFAEMLPRNASGKLLKRELRAPYWEGRGRQVN